MSSNGRVTITLGGSRQVVKRPRALSDVSHSEIGVAPSGSKQDLRERLESSTSQYKRQRTQNSNSILGGITMKDSCTNSNHHVDHYDLRLKLVNKQRRQATEGQQDLREKLSWKRQVSFRSNSQQSTRGSGAQQSLRVGSSDPVKLLPPRRSVDDLLRLDSVRESYYSSLPMDGKRLISRDKLIGVSRAMPPRKSYEEMQHAQITRPMDAPRHPTLMTNGAVDPLRSVPYTSRTLVPTDAAKPVVRVPPPTTTSIASRSPHQPETPVTVSDLLKSLDLEKYGISFLAEEVDMAVLKQMGDSDLKELGIPMGPRKKILLALLSSSKQ